MSEIVIIGAGPAGSLAALLLARAGRAVLMIEQHRFPRDKVCGECISALGVEVLARHGLLARLIDAGAMWMERFVIHSPGGRSAAADLPAPMLGISREVLDELLLEAAREAGAEVRQPVRAEGIQPAVRVRDLKTNRVEEIEAGMVLLADGRAAFARERPVLTGDLGIKAHFEGLAGPRNAVQLFGVAFAEPRRGGNMAGPGCYGGIAPIEGGRFNLAFSVPAEWVKAAGGVEEAFARIIEGSLPLAERLHPGRRVSQWLAGPLPRYGVQRGWLAGVIPIGNAAAAIEPIGGEGMGLALRSAELAVGMILSNGDAASLEREYRRLWRMRGWACRAAAMCVSRPALCGVAVEAMASWEAMRDAALSWMGKAPTPRYFHSGPVG